MDGIRQKMASIRKEQEDTQEKYEQLLIANKKLEADKLSQEMDIKSLQAQLVATQQTATKLETDLEEAKVANRESELLRQEYDMLQNRYQRLEQEAEVSEKQTDELKSNLNTRNLEVESLKNGMAAFDKRQVENEDKYAELDRKFKEVTDELEAFQHEINNI